MATQERSKEGEEEVPTAQAEEEAKEGKDENEDDDMKGEEQPVARGMRLPQRPSRAKIAEHKLTHIPFPGLVHSLPKREVYKQRS